MRRFKYVWGIMLMVLSTVGFFLCIGGLFGTWVGRNYAGLLVDRVDQATEASFKAIDHRMDMVKSTLQETEDRIRPAISRAREVERSKSENEVSLAAEAISRLADDQVREKLKRMEEVTSSISISAQSIGHAFALLALTSRDSEAASIEEAPLVIRIQRVSEVVRETLALLDKVRDAADQLNTNPKLAGELVPRMRSHLTKIDESMESAKNSLSHLDQSIQKIRSRVQHWKNQIPGWINMGTVLISLLMSWMGVGQLSLFFCGWRICR